MMNTKFKWLLLLLVMFLYCPDMYAQVEENEDTMAYNVAELERMLNREYQGTSRPGHTAATFKSTRIINSHSIENTGKGVLDFRIGHRFGKVNEGIKNLYGLDNATTKFAFDYGVTDWLTVGIGRSSFEKEYEGFFKVKLLRQSTDNRRPVSVSVVGGSSVRTMDVLKIQGYNYDFSNRVCYFSQVLAARKFNQWLSLQLTPTYVHYNLVSEADEPNDVYALGFGGRVKVSKRIAITGEYFYTVPGYRLNGYNNSVSLGVDIETGGHVFQLFLTNSAAISERTFVGQTRGDIFKGDVHLGFNISRVFTIVKPKQ